MITLRAKVGESEKLYGSITGADIAEELGKSAGHDVDKKKIELKEPIRQLGSHDVTIRFTHDITAVIKVNVISDETTEEKPEKKEKKTRSKATKKAKVEEAVAEEPETKEEPAAEAPEAEAVEAKAEEAIMEEAEAIEEEMDAREKE